MKFTWKSFFFLALMLFFFACEKDLPLPDEGYVEVTSPTTNPQNGFAKYRWSQKEARFFSLAPPFDLQSKVGSGDEKTGLANGTIYHPLIVDGYNRIAEQNLQENFVETIVDEMGIPYWEKAVVYDNGSPDDEIVLVPFLNGGTDKFSGVIAIEREQNELIINGMSRENLLRTEEGNPEQRAIYAEWMYSYQSWLLDTPADEELKEAYCRYTEITESLGGGGNPPSESDCEWRLVEVCSDDDSQTTWIGGRENIPPHLDHDRDGILNEDDQDWWDFIRRYDITQQDWEYLVYDWWQDNYQGTYGGYDDYYSNDDDYRDDLFAQLWDQYEAWLEENGYGSGGRDGTDWGPNQDEHPDHYPDDCPWWDGGFTSSGGREIRCDFFYMLYCSSEENGDWWDYDNMIICHSCTGEQDSDYEQYFFQQKFEAYINEHNLQDEAPYLDDLLTVGDCPAQVADEVAFECFTATLLNIFTEENDEVTLTDAENSWLSNNPGVLGELLTSSAANGQGQLSQDYIDQFISVCTTLQLDSENARWLLYNSQVLSDLQSFIDENAIGEHAEQASMAAKITLLAARANAIDDLGSQQNHEIWNEFEYCLPYEEELNGGYTGWLEAPDLVPYEDMLSDEMAILRMLNPDWSNLRVRIQAEYNILSDGIHTILDIAGLMEGLGLVPDVLNGIFYAIEGDGANATMSFAGAMPGGFVVTSTRVMRKIVTVGNSTRRFTWKLRGGKIVWSHNSSYRKVWKGVYSELDDATYRAHHVIPQAKWDHPMVQHASKANPDNLTSGIDPFHMNMPANGWPVHQTRHTGNHPNYSDQIEDKMTQWMADHPSASAEEAATAMAQWQILLKNAMGQGTGGPNINDINLPDIP